MTEKILLVIILTYMYFLLKQNYELAKKVKELSVKLERLELNCYLTKYGRGKIKWIKQEEKQENT